MKDFYSFEIELKDGTTITSGNDYLPESVVRVSLIPQITILPLPRHDIIFTDFKFVKRFGRGFLKQGTGMKEYLQCVITTWFRMYLKCSNGNILITEQNYELYL